MSYRLSYKTNVLKSGQLLVRVSSDDFKKVQLMIYVLLQITDGQTLPYIWQSVFQLIFGADFPSFEAKDKLLLTFGHGRRLHAGATLVLSSDHQI